MPRACSKKVTTLAVRQIRKHYFVKNRSWHSTCYLPMGRDSVFWCTGGLESLLKQTYLSGVGSNRQGSSIGSVRFRVVIPPLMNWAIVRSEGVNSYCRYDAPEPVVNITQFFSYEWRVKCGFRVSSVSDIKDTNGPKFGRLGEDKNVCLMSGYTIRRSITQSPTQANWDLCLQKSEQRLNVSLSETKSCEPIIHFRRWEGWHSLWWNKHQRLSLAGVEYPRILNIRISGSAFDFHTFRRLMRKF